MVQEDSLTHKVHIIEANGESFRLKEARRSAAVGSKILELWDIIDIPRSAGYTNLGDVLLNWQSPHFYSTVYS